jgi:hypothetical protein
VVHYAGESFRLFKQRCDAISSPSMPLAASHQSRSIEQGVPSAAPSMITDPYYCWVDGIGFSDERRFAHHLHEVHGVPLDEALASTELMDGQYVFFGY